MRHGNRSPSNGCPGATSIVLATALMASVHPPIPGGGSFARQIRAKLSDDAANPAWIFNERGVGYRMARPGEE